MEPIYPKTYPTVMPNGIAKSALPYDRVAFDGGAIRSEKLPPIGDIPLCGIIEVGKRFAIGEDKYGRFNWKHGGPEFFRQAGDHAIRHLYAYTNGESYMNEDTPVGNLAAAAWGCLVLLWWEIIGKFKWSDQVIDKE